MTSTNSTGSSSPSLHQGSGISRPARGKHAGVVGMGLMGTSIAACLLSAGHQVTAVEINPTKRKASRSRLLNLLAGLRRERLLKHDPRKVIAGFSVSGDYSALKSTTIVIESTAENLATKLEVIRMIEEVVSRKTLIGSNTSAIPATQLQEGALYPERILGIHWAEPAHITRFMEVICGEQTLPRYAKCAMELARSWGKEPSLVRKDVRGFITNRVMYAMLREAFHLVETGVASIADVDRSLRNDLGYWMTFAGPFRFMDLTGIPAYASVMRDMFPDLNCATTVPSLMTAMVQSGAKGISNAKGFYSYTPRQAKNWEKRFMQFSYDIRGLAERYPGDDRGNLRTDGRRRTRIA